MKVLLVYNESTVEGKGNIDLFSVQRELKRLGHTPVIVARRDGKARDGIYAMFPDPMKAFFSLPLLASRMAGIIRHEKPDIIVAEGGWYIPCLISFANRGRIPVVYVFRGLVLEVLVAFHAKSLIVKAAARLFIAINYRIFRKGKQHLVGTNTSICKFYRERLQRPVELVGTHLMDLAKFKPMSEEDRKATRARFSITLEGTAVLYSGAMEEWHLPYLTDLAKAVAELVAKGKQVQLVVMGWGSCRDRFADKLKEIHALSPSFSSVMLPFMQHEDVPKIIASCDVCVDPLLRPYPMDHAPAGKLMEYMACGACVVTTKGYSNEELVQDHKNGLLVDGTYAALSAALEELVGDQQLVCSLGAAARETVMIYFASINKSVALERYLKKVAEEGG